MQATTARPKITVTTDGAGVVSHAGTRLLADLADATTLTEQFSQALQGVRGPRARHDPGRVLVDLAVAIADGAEAICDIAVLADRPALFGPVASDSTCWRLLDALDADRLSTIAGARAREVAWAQRAECGVRRRKDGELVAQDEDLGILGQRRAAEQHQPAEEAVSRPVRRWGVLVRDTGTSTTSRATASDQNVQ